MNNAAEAYKRAYWMYATSTKVNAFGTHEYKRAFYNAMFCARGYHRITGQYISY